MLKFEGSYLFDSSPEVIWPFIFDPEKLIGLIPGCSQLEQVKPDEYRGKLVIGIASISGVYDTIIHIDEVKPLSSCTFSGEVNGPTGIIQGTASFYLKEVEKKTELDYRANAQLTGALSKLNPRFIEGVVTTLINQGLSKLNAQLAEQKELNLQ
jgi:carbon monoxide dehydrogenase subunit G